MIVQTAYRHHFQSANGIRFHFVDAGAGPPILLLHGFPEFWYSWRRQLPALASAGFRAIAPDLRGYNESEHPAGVSAYRPSVLVNDVAGFIEEIIQEPVYLLGHDWGGVLAWRCAALYPRLIRKLIVLNAPHPAARQEALRKRPWLWLQSLYVLFFQLPHLPERLLRAGDFAVVERAWQRDPVHSGAFSDEDIAHYKRVFGTPDALAGPLNYYRAALRYHRELIREPQAVPLPTLVLWGERDPYLSLRLIENLDRWVPNLEIQRIPDASHWIQNDVPERVNRAVVEFCRQL